MFQKCGSLVSLSSGVNATQEVQDDLMRAEELGKVQAEKFIEDRICLIQRKVLRHDKEQQTKNVYLHESIKDGFCEGERSCHPC